MKNFIEHIIEPNELFLCWMAINASRRRRYIVGKINRRDDGIVQLQYFNERYEVKEAQRAGFRGFPAFPNLGKTYDELVLETFMKRLPPKRRRDFKDYIEWFGIRGDKAAELSEMALLGYTGAKVANDGFSLIHPFDTSGPFEFLLEIAGFRHRSELSPDQISEGEEVKFLPEYENEWDENAVQIHMKEKLLGYVDSGRASFLKGWIEKGRNIKGQIARINGTSDRTLIYVFVKVFALHEELI